ncbi:MAG: redoxin domain-containing protein [Pseudomonadota bacterium]
MTVSELAVKCLGFSGACLTYGLAETEAGFRQQLRSGDMALKSFLLTPVLLVLTAISCLALVRLIGGDPVMPWFGVLLAAAPLPGFVSVLMLAKPSGRTSRHLPGLLFVTALGVALAVLSGPASGWGPAILASAAALAFLWYDFIYSDLGRTPSVTLRQGGPLPEFDVQNLDGAPVSSRDFLGGRTLILFYRGNWCPLCMAQVNELAARYRALSEMGVDVVLISPQPQTQTEALALRFDVDMKFLTDPDGQAAQSLQIAAPDGTPSGLTLFGYAKDTVLPTVIAIDAEGTIIYLDQTDNYRVRPEPDLFLEIFRGRAAASGDQPVPAPVGSLQEGSA